MGATVTVSFHRGSDRNPLMLEAEVVRSGTTDGGRQRGIAVRFKDVSEFDESVLNELIERTRT
jgi:hypothetical protein